MHNPSLREEPRNRPAAIISTEQQVSILDWLESIGRLIPRETNSYDPYKEDPEELSALMIGEDGSYLDEEDDEAVAEDDDEE